MTRIFLQRTPDEKMMENPNLPYFRLVLPPEQDGGEWVDIGALWPARSGNGYSGKLDDGVLIDTSMKNPRPQPAQPQQQMQQPQMQQPQYQQGYYQQPQQQPQQYMGGGGLQQAPQQPQPQQPPQQQHAGNTGVPYPQQDISPDDIPFNN